MGLLFGLFLILLFLGSPIAYALGISSIVYLWIYDPILLEIPKRMVEGLNSFALLSVPGFILAGNIMSSGSITSKIVDFANSVMGHVRGGLGLVNVGSSMLFAGISGTAIADTSSIGAIMIPAMKKEGYDAPFSVALTASSSTVGPIIPPSLPMIIVGTLTGLSVRKLFMASFIPGILLGIALLIVSYTISVLKSHPKNARKFSIINVIKTFRKSFWAIMMTVVILYGILGGIFTPTEASIIAVVYAVLVEIFIYKELRFKDLPSIILTSMKNTASILLLVAFANLFARILASEQIPQQIAGVIMEFSNGNKLVFLLLVNILLLFVGSFMETIAALIILVPVLLETAVSFGINPIHFGVMVVLNLMIGLTTPPVGVCLFVASDIGNVDMGKTIRALLPFLLISLLVLMLVAYIPSLTLWLPTALYG